MQLNRHQRFKASSLTGLIFLFLSLGQRAMAAPAEVKMGRFFAEQDEDYEQVNTNLPEEQLTAQSLESKPERMPASMTQSPPTPIIAPEPDNPEQNENRTPASFLPSVPEFKTSTEGSEKPHWSLAGFIDFRYNQAEHSNLRFDPDDLYYSGFNIGDGALYGEYKRKSLTITADIPFSSTHVIDGSSPISPSSVISSIVQNNTLEIGQRKAQLFATYQFTPHLSIVAGQWDTPLGYEANDTAYRFFETMGVIGYDLTPYTHTGVMLDAKWDPLEFKLFVADPYNQAFAAFVSADNPLSSADDRLEFGLTVNHLGETLKGQMAALIRPEAPTPGTQKFSDSLKRNRFLLDIILEYDGPRLTLAAETMALFHPIKNVPSLDYSITDNKIGLAALLFASFNVVDSWNIAARIEFANFNTLAATSYLGYPNPDSNIADVYFARNEIDYALGTHWVPFGPEDFIEVRLEWVTRLYRYDSTKLTDRIKDQMITVASLYRF
jgi:hypothetical protein